MRDSFTILSAVEERKSPFPLLLLVMVAFLLVVCVSPLAAEEKAKTNNESVSAPKSCMKAALLDTNILIAKSATAKKENKGKMIPKKELLRPMTKKEMRLMLRAFEPVKLKEGWTIGASMEDMEVDLNRMGIVLNDAIALLVVLQSSETLARLKKTPGVKEEQQDWMERAFQTARACAQASFKNRGGEAAYEASMRIVRKYRRELESLILKTLKLETPRQPGGKR